MAKQISLITLVFTFILVVGGQLPVEAGQTRTLELVIALDTSGSMSERIASSNSNERNEIDAGNNLLFFGGGGNPAVSLTEASDPQYLSFKATETLLSWVAAYAAQNDGLDIRVSVLKFDTTAEALLPMKTLGNNDAISGIQLERPAGSRRHSDFIELYNEAANIFASGDENARQAFIVVTDSPPCNPLGEPQTESGVSVRNEFCDNDAGRLAPHLANARQLPARIEQYVFFINPTGRNSGANYYPADLYWDVYNNVRDEWQQLAGSFFFDLNVVEELPQMMQRTIMREIGIASRAIDSETTPGISLNAEQYRALGLLYSSNGEFEIPPYQSALNLLLLLGDGEAQVDFEMSGEMRADYRAESSQLPLRYAFIQKPPIGELEITATGTTMEVWGTLTSAEPRVTLQPAQPRQYQPQQIIYQFVDGNDVLDVSEAATPNFILNVVSPSGEVIPLGGLELRSAEQGFVSSQFLPTEIGNYTIELSTSPGQSEVWTSDVSYDFLQVPLNELPVLTVAPVTFSVAYLVDGVQASNPVVMPRSLPLSLVLTAAVDGEAVSIPDGIAAQVSFDTTGIEDACAPMTAPATMQMNPERTEAVYSVDFDNPGSCELSVNLTMTNALPPLGNESIVVATSNLDRRIEIDDTELLSVVVMTEAGEDTSQNASDVDFRLAFPETILGRNSPFGNASTAVLVEVRNEAGDPVWPGFTNDAEPIQANVELCGNPARIVPVQLVITNSADENVAPRHDICLLPTDTTGRYRAEITGLGIGTYEVRVVVNRDEPRLDAINFEYDPAQFSSTVTQISSQLRVSIPVVWILTAAGIVVAIVGGVTLFTLEHQQNQRRLRGAVAFYIIPQDVFDNPDSDNESISPVWRKPWGKRRQHQFRGREFLRVEYIKNLQIQHLTGTTEGDVTRSKQRGAKITLSLQRRGETTVNSLNNAEFASKQAAYIDTIKGMRIYLVQDAPETMTIGEILRNTSDEKSKLQ